MKKHNANNERIKREYVRFLKESKGQNDASLDAVVMAFSRFETYTGYCDFKKYHYEQAIGFKKYLAKQNGQQSGKQLSLATRKTTLRHLKTFFQWLGMQPGYKSRINFTDAEYFNLSEKDSRIATASRKKSPPTLEQINRVIEVMPTTTVIDRRNRALIAFTLLTGARDKAIASAKLKHIDLTEASFFHDAREVDTKNSKTFKTFFLPVGDDIRQIVIDWVNYLKTEELWGDDDPLFSKTALALDDNRLFKANGLARSHWSTANAIRGIFKAAFANAGLPYFNPHLFRDTLTKLGQRLCKTPEQFKAWSQNFGHQHVLTTFISYGEVEVERQGELIRGLSSIKAEEKTDVKKLAQALARELRVSSLR